MPEIVDALLQSNAPKIYISNLMTQPGETDGLDVYQHIKAINYQILELTLEFLTQSYLRINLKSLP